MTNSQRNKIIAYCSIALLVSSLAMFGYTASLLRSKTEREVLHYRNLEKIAQEAIEKPQRVEILQVEE